ncbi:MAG TPA: Gfo/Idh/MocA family oxidoreductase [Candidatus Dormibacteraeota bacterium]|jgi:predicted dehydrogenase|nr:Gfo/Idh/MocA family oxidoreductase [Candidatus Dormibacteraeota bacterium]
MPVAIGLCGLGSAAARAHLPALSRAEETGAGIIAGVCDPDPSRREQFLVGAAGARGYADVVALLDGVRPDLLVISSPPSAHLSAIAAAVERGVDVLCEKPLGLSHADVAVLAELVAAHPERLIAPVHQYRLAPPWRVFTRALQVAAARDCGFRLDVEVERPGTDPLSAGGWRSDPEHEGGILGDHAVHYLAMLWLSCPSMQVTACERSGDPGRETARALLDLGRGSGSITVTYAGHARRNRIALDIPSAGFHLDWQDDALTVTRRGGPGSVRRVGALSARQFVNDLYGPLYDELLARIDDPAWRAERTAETLGVARLLAGSLEAAGTTR